jgi:hypothetical protein
MSTLWKVTKFGSKASANSKAKLEGYRSGLEEKVAAQLKAEGMDAVYEGHTLRYTKPEKEHRYTPDFVMKNGIVIETKGRFVTADRQKHLFVKAAHPDLDIRFVFSNPRQRIGKKSLTTYAMWCEKNGFLYSTIMVPQPWLKEPAVAARIRAAFNALGWRP